MQKEFKNRREVAKSKDKEWKGGKKQKGLRVDGQEGKEKGKGGKHSVGGARPREERVY